VPESEQRPVELLELSDLLDLSESSNFTKLPITPFLQLMMIPLKRKLKELRLLRSKQRKTEFRLKMLKIQIKFNMVQKAPKLNKLIKMMRRLRVKQSE
jgi:hypothetical protein